MDLTSIIKAVLTPHNDGVRLQLPDLKQGDRVVGKVLKLESDGKVLMDLKGNRALARTAIPVKVGQSLQLRVVDSGSILHLQVEPVSSKGQSAGPVPLTDFNRAMNPADQEKFTRIARQLIESSTLSTRRSDIPVDLKGALKQIISVFEAIPMDKATEQVSKWIKHAVEDRGLLLEKKMADAITQTAEQKGQVGEPSSQGQNARVVITHDVKSQLMHLQRMFSLSEEKLPALLKLDPKEISFLRKGVDQLLGHIEVQQERAVARWADGDSQQVFVHTFPYKDQNDAVQLKVYYREKENHKKSGTPHRIALLLDMSKLGPVRVDMTMQARSLQITFYVQNEKTRNIVARQIKGVEASVSGIFDQISLDVFVSEKKIAQFQSEDAKPSGAGRINLKA